MTPNLVTSSRFVLGLVMIYFAYVGSYFMFFLMYFIALMSDILDGYLARRLNKKTKLGAKLDIIADNFIVLCLLFSLFLFKRYILVKYSLLFVFLFIYYLLIQTLIKKKYIFMRTYAANLAAIIFPFVILSMIIVEIKVVIYFYFILMLYSLTEKLFLELENKKKVTIFTLKFNTIAMFLIITSVFITIFLNVPLLENKICFENKVCIPIEVMDNPLSRQFGLMYRNSLEGGMLFVFDHTDEYSFWMKNVRFPIDMILLDENETILNIIENVQPCYQEPCPVYTSKARYVLEVNAGFSEKNRLKI